MLSLVWHGPNGLGVDRSSCMAWRQVRVLSMFRSKPCFGHAMLTSETREMSRPRIRLAAVLLSHSKQCVAGRPRNKPI